MNSGVNSGMSNRELVEKLWVDLNNVKHLGVKVPGPSIRPQPSGPTEE